MSNATTVSQSEQAKDRAVTLRNRARLGANKNLLFWYRELYRDQFKEFPNPAALSILEIGSGTSPLKQFLSNVVTSDVLDLDYLDLVFDCHEIDKLDVIKDNSLDVITVTNVFLHHEPVDFRISDPELIEVQGPLVSANIALPWLIFFRNHEWLQRLSDKFDLAHFAARPFSALSYMITGGISHRLPVPCSLYRMLFPVDLVLSRCFPRFCAAFFTVTLTHR